MEISTEIEKIRGWQATTHPSYECSDCGSKDARKRPGPFDHKWEELGCPNCGKMTYGFYFLLRGDVMRNNAMHYLASIAFP